MARWPRRRVIVSPALQLEVLDQLEQARAAIDQVLTGQVHLDGLVDQVWLVYSRAQNALVATNDARFDRAA